MTTRKIKLVIHYDGTAYHGWARQPGMPTIQGTIEAAFEKLTGQSIEVIGSSRTDAGVHALGQVAHVVLNDCPVPTENLQKAVNNLLPEEIAILNPQEIDDSFDAIASTKSKIYQYRIFTGLLRPVMQVHHCWHLPLKLNIKAMQQAAEQLIGKKDFKSFASASDQRQSSVRKVMECEVMKYEYDVVINVEADGFLYNMVRNIVGTLVEIGRGRWEPDIITEILEAKDRSTAGPIAPASGLYLMQIFY